MGEALIAPVAGVWGAQNLLRRGAAPVGAWAVSLAAVVCRSVIAQAAGPQLCTNRVPDVSEPNTSGLHRPSHRHWERSKGVRVRVGCELWSGWGALWLGQCCSLLLELYTCPLPHGHILAEYSVPRSCPRDVSKKRLRKQVRKTGAGQSH